MMKREPPQSKPSTAGGSSSSSARFLSRLLSLSSLQHNSDESQLNNNNDANDDCQIDCIGEEEAGNSKQTINGLSILDRLQNHNNNTIALVDEREETSSSFPSHKQPLAASMKRIGGSGSSQTAESFSGTVSVATENMEETSSLFDICDTIDDCMSSLYTDLPLCCDDDNNSTDDYDYDNNIITAVVPSLPTSLQLRNNNNNSSSSKDIHYEYDWILDGTPPSTPIKESDTAASRRRRLFGDDKLDLMLGMLEIENQEYVSCDEYDDDDDDDSLECGSPSLDNGVGNGTRREGGQHHNIVDFADFSKLELEQQGSSVEFGSFNAAKEEKDDNDEGMADNDANMFDGVARKAEQQQDGDNTIQSPCESGQTYEPPEAIGCLVNDISNQLDTTVDECLEISNNNVSVVEIQNVLSDDQDDIISVSERNLLSEINQSETMLHGGKQNEYEGKHHQQQSLLMSSELLETLPVPLSTETVGDDDDALIASFTRRIQQQHQESISMIENSTNKEEEIEREDDLLEQTLSDIIHHGYFEETETDVNDTHYFDSIVLEEILTVPWPFHEITDLNESFFGEGVFDSSDLEDSSDEHLDGLDELNFDTYISNRLSQLHDASAQVMRCLHKRASEKEESINQGIQSVFATEIEIETALLFTKSSREFLHRAMHGYPVSHDGMKQQQLHNAVCGGLDIPEYSDCRDRLGLLLVTLDGISSIREKEAKWWNALSDRKISMMEKIPLLLEEVRNLKQLTLLDETLTNLECMKETNERIHQLPGVLVCLIEESLAHLFDRILSDDTSHDKFDGYFAEYKTLFQSWIMCIELRDGEHSNAIEWCSAVSTEWSGYILDILCFAVKKAVANAMIDSFTNCENGVANDRDEDLIKESKRKLRRMRLKSKDESDLESLSQKLLLNGAGGTFNCTALSLTFFHLSSRIVELLVFYDVTCQWQHTMINSESGEVQEPEYFADDECNQDETVQSILLARASVSTVSSKEDSASLLSNEASEEEAASSVKNKPLPSRIAFKQNKVSSLDWAQAIAQSVGCIRHALWKYCEESLIHVVESFSPDAMGLGCHHLGRGVDATTSSLHLTYDTFQQFATFSKHFNGDTADDTLCDTLKHSLWKLYRSHLRSVHFEAMKNTGSFLRQESWQLSPISISRNGKVVDGKSDLEVGALYEALKELFLKAYPCDTESKGSFNVMTRSCQRGYKYCDAFVEFLQRSDSTDDNRIRESERVNEYFGACSTGFCLAVSPLIERSPCGELTLTLLSTSVADGLVKWTALLLAIGNNLPLVAVDATNAVVTLFDLFFLTVFRICASSSSNEDVLLGLGRGTSVQSLSSSLMSVTMEADACAPLPCEAEGIATLQEFIQKSRKRLKKMVNMDKFQSMDQVSIGSPVNQHKTAALRLEKESAAAFSCLVAAIIADIASEFCKPEDMDISIEEYADDDNESLTSYAQNAISVMPMLVKQSCHLSATRSLSGKELVFKIICCGKAWADSVFKEYSNDYVDDLCERASLLWGHISSRGKLPPTAQILIWDHIVRSSFMLLLEGFSKIATCSTEGRSLMSMDLATLSAGLVPGSVKEKLEDSGFPNVSHPPSQARREDSMRYVDTWIKVFFFPEEDAMNWIKQNRDQYHLDHSISLIVAKIPPKNKQELALKKKAVFDIYH